MSDIIARAQKSSAIINDRSLQQFERVWPALKALSGLIVSDLADVPRAAIEAQMVAINHISANHTIESEDDYKQLTDEEAEEILSRIGTVNQLCIDSEAGRIMHELVSAEQKLPEAAIEEVRQHRDIFVPLLMRHLEQTVTSVRNGEEIEENASFFALFLLSELQVDDAFPIILDALRLPEDAAFELFGDAVHEITPRLLAQFSHGKVDAIDQIIRDSNSTIYVRWSAAQAYTFLVRDGLISRQFAVDALHAHFQHCMENQEYFLLAPLACVLGDLAAGSPIRLQSCDRGPRFKSSQPGRPVSL